jgi:hypothetical protein
VGEEQRGRGTGAVHGGRWRGSSDGGEAAAPLPWIGSRGWGRREGAVGDGGQIHGVTHGRQIHTRGKKGLPNSCLHFILFSSRDREKKLKRD